ncbi:MAG: NAD(P)/FAD-dependent oxidoreductase [Beijerinckiaceae bacterium]
MKQTMGSLWQATAAPAVTAPALQGKEQAEIVIIGAGYTGLSTALHLAEMGRDVVVVEAEEPGAGGSGRNGGQVIPGLRHFTDELTAKYGDDLGKRIHAFGAGDADYTFALIKRLGLQCDATRTGWIQAAENTAELAQGHQRCEAWAKRGAATRILDRQEFEALTGTDAYIGGWMDERGGSVQPLSYVRELARAAIKAGVRLYQHSTAISMEARTDGWEVTTPQGSVRAKKMLLATNASTGALHGRIARSQLGVWSFQIASRPLTPQERAKIMPSRVIVSDTRRVLRYFRLDRDHRVVVGGKGTLSAPADAQSFNLQLAMLKKLYPTLAEAGFDYAWGGLIGITIDRLPRLFSIGDNAWSVLQDNGKGVAWCTAMGQPLAELLTGADSRTLPLVPEQAPQPIPFHGMRKAYVAAGNTWLRFLDRTDRLR